MMGKASVSQPVRRRAKNEWIVSRSTTNTHTNPRERKKSGLCAAECFRTQSVSHYQLSS